MSVAKQIRRSQAKQLAADMLRGDGRVGMRVQSAPGLVALDFGRHVTRLPLSPEGARQLADALHDHARRAESSVALAPAPRPGFWRRLFRRGAR